MKQQKTATTAVMTERLRQSAPRLLPFIGALLITAGILGLTLVQRAARETSFDTRKDASVVDGDVVVRARVIDPNDPDEVTVVVEMDTNKADIDGVQLDFAIQTQVADQITINPTPPKGLTTVKAAISPSRSQDAEFRAQALFVTQKPIDPYSNDTYAPLFTLKFTPDQAGSFDIIFDRVASMATQHASINADDILQHIESLSFDMPDPDGDSDDDDGDDGGGDDDSDTVSACGYPTELELDEVSCGGEDKLYIDLDWKRPDGAQEFEVWLSQDSDYDYIFKRITTTSSEWKPDYSINDRRWYAKVRVIDTDASCSTPGNWAEITFDVDCDDDTNTIKACNESCNGNNECPVNHACVETSDGKRCRLATNQASTSCDATEDFVADSRSCNTSCYETSDCAGDLVCWHNTCRAVDNLLSPVCTPAGVGGTTAQQCNEACGSNLDCDANLICHQGSCRLVTNPASAICAPPNDSDVSDDPKGGSLDDTATATDSASATGSAQIKDNEATDSAETATRAAIITQKPDLADGSDPFSDQPPATNPEQNSNEKGFFAWLKRLLGISGSSSNTNNTTDNTDTTDSSDSSVTTIANNSANSSSSNRPGLAVMLLVIGLSILFLIILIAIIRSILGLNKPRGVVTVQKAPPSTPPAPQTPASQTPTQQRLQQSQAGTTDVARPTSRPQPVMQTTPAIETQRAPSRIKTRQVSTSELAAAQAKTATGTTPQKVTTAGSTPPDSSMLQRMKARNIKTPK